MWGETVLRDRTTRDGVDSSPDRTDCRIPVLLACMVDKRDNTQVTIPLEAGSY